MTPAVRVLAFDDGVARVAVAGALVVDLVVRRLPAGDVRLVLPAGVVAFETAISREIEGQVIRQLRDRGDLTGSSELDEDEDAIVDLRSKRTRERRRTSAR